MPTLHPGADPAPVGAHHVPLPGVRVCPDLGGQQRLSHRDQLVCRVRGHDHLVGEQAGQRAALPAERRVEPRGGGEDQPLAVGQQGRVQALLDLADLHLEDGRLEGREPSGRGRGSADGQRLLAPVGGGSLGAIGTTGGPRACGAVCGGRAGRPPVGLLRRAGVVHVSRLCGPHTLGGLPHAILTPGASFFTTRPRGATEPTGERAWVGPPREREPACRTSGTGLGLAIVKQLVESMGGWVRPDSVIGEGSTFAVRLPSGGN